MDYQRGLMRHIAGALINMMIEDGTVIDFEAYDVSDLIFMRYP